LVLVTRLSSPMRFTPLPTLSATVLSTTKLQQLFISTPSAPFFSTVLETRKLQHPSSTTPAPPLPETVLLETVVQQSVSTMPPSAPQQSPIRTPVSALFDESTLRITTQHEVSSPMPTSKLRILPFAIAIDPKCPPPSEIPSPVPLPVMVWPFMSSETPSLPTTMQVPVAVRFVVRK